MASVTRQRLLDAAVELLLDGDSVGLTTGRLTSKAGVVQSAFYNHFSSVAECRQTALDEVRSHVVSSSNLIFTEVRTPGSDAVDDLTQILQRVFQRAIDQPAPFRLLIHRMHAPDVAALVDDVIDNLQKAMAQAILHESSSITAMTHAQAELSGELVIGSYLGSLKAVLGGANPEWLAVATANYMSHGLVAVARVELPSTPQMGDLAVDTAADDGSEVNPAEG